MYRRESRIYKTLVASFFVYRRESRDRFRIYKKMNVPRVFSFYFFYSNIFFSTLFHRFKAALSLHLHHYYLAYTCNLGQPLFIIQIVIFVNTCSCNVMCLYFTNCSFSRIKNTKFSPFYIAVFVSLQFSV